MDDVTDEREKIRIELRQASCELIMWSSLLALAVVINVLWG